MAQLFQLLIAHLFERIVFAAEQLRERGHDADENVRMDVIQAIISAGKRDYTKLTDSLLECVRERMLDKKVRQSSANLLLAVSCIP